MELTLASLALLALLAFWVCLPFAPALLELKERKDAGAVSIFRDSEVDVHYFARSFQRFLAERLGEALARCRQQGARQEGRLEDGTRYLVIDGRSVQEVGSSTGIVASCGVLRTAPHGAYDAELWAEDGAVGGEGCTYKSILSNGDIDLGPGSTALRWVHAGKALRVGEEGTLYGRASASEEIVLCGPCCFERLHAPRIAFGREEKAAPSERGAASSGQSSGTIDPATLGHVVDVAAGRWLFEGRLEIPAGTRIDADLVATGPAHIGERALVAGSIKSRKDLHLEGGAVVTGSLVSEGSLHLGDGCRIHGPVLAEGDIFVGPECEVGSVDKPTTLSARRIQVAPGAVVHGSVWAHQRGYAEGARAERRARAASARSPREARTTVAEV
jgi:cytoskeletal protein CcmA (bactofilin family)